MSEKNKWAVSKLTREAFRTTAAKKEDSSFGGTGVQHDLTYVAPGEHTGTIIGFAQRADGKLFLHVKSATATFRAGIPVDFADWAAQSAEENMEIKVTVSHAVIDGEIRRWATLTTIGRVAASPPEQKGEKANEKSFA